jgi:chromosome partitioning protein
LTINALTAADKVIVPVQCEYLSMRGLIQLQNTLSMIQENLNPTSRSRDPAHDGRHPDLARPGGAASCWRRTSGAGCSPSADQEDGAVSRRRPLKGMSVLKYDAETARPRDSYRALAKEVLSHGKR